MGVEFAVVPPRRTYLYREKSDSVKNLYRAQAVAQGKFAKVTKNKTAQYGPFADLAALKDATVPALAANGLCVTQEYHVMEGDLYLVTVLGHESGEWVSSIIPIKQAASPQQTMGYMTYMRRAAYAALLCLAAEDDDDGEVASTAAASASVENEMSLEKRASAAIQTATTKDALDTLLRKVEQRVNSGDMTKDSLERLREVAVKVMIRLSEQKK